MTEYWGIHNDQSSIDPVADGAVRIGWDEVGDLSRLQPTRDAFKERLSEVISDQDTSVAAWSGTLFRFIHVVAVGDIVVSPNRAARTLNIGRVSGGYEFHEDAAQYRHWRPVEWLATGVSRDELSLPAQNALSAATTLFALTTGKEEIKQVLADPPSTSDQATFDWVPFYEELTDVIRPFRIRSA